MTRHLLISDTQVKKDVPVDHLRALGNFIVDKQPEVLINIGDWADMPSLSVYDKPGTKAFEGKRYRDDVEASIEAMEIMEEPITRYNNMRKRNKKSLYRPRKVLTLGNHENRIDRAVNLDPRLDGTLSVDDLRYEDFGWEVYPFLHIVDIDGVAYSHYFINPDSAIGSPLGGTIENKMKLIGHSFTMGHNQKRQYGIRYNGRGEEIHGLVSGAYYMHDEEYQNPQGNRAHWRGIVLKNEVREGRYDPTFLSLEYMLREWT